MQGGEYGDFRVDGYEIEGLLGAGPTGELWLARHTASHSHVGLKRLHPKDVDAHDEARRIHAVLGMLNHSSLLRVRELLSYGNDELVLVLDRAEGGTLDQLLMARPMLDPGEAVMIGATIAHALAAIHEHGLVHGDVTPESIVFTDEGQPLLSDVGLSGLVERWDVLGTHGYTDPASSTTPEAPGDIYGLAAVCYTALSGTPLDPGQPRRPLHQVNPGVPAALSHAIEAGLQEQPQSRPDAASFAAQLDAAAPRSALRFPDGPVGGFTGLSGGGGDGPAQDPFVLGASQGASAQPGSQQTTGGSALFGTGGPQTAPSPPFMPGAPAPTATGQQTAPSPYGPPQTPDDDDDEDGRRPRRQLNVPWKSILIGIPVVLVIVVASVFGISLFSGGSPGPEPTTQETNGTSTAGTSEADRPKPELSGPNAKKWATVYNELDDRRAKAFETLDEAALANVYVPNSDPLDTDRDKMNQIKNSSENNVRFVGVKGVWTYLISLETASESPERVELNVVTEAADPYYFVTADGDPLSQSPDSAGQQLSSTVVLVPDGNGRWLISEDRPTS